MDGPSPGPVTPGIVERIHSLHVMGFPAALSAVKGMRLYRRALELVSVGHKASLRKNEKESFRP